tara:strand:- start:89944 stop:91332 length:1389 start_codon:yes stop_codon:yes gene_type:complete
MTDKSEKKLNDVPFRITDPERIPAKRYYDEQFFKLEQELLWPHVWQMACRLEQITEIGDYVEYRILDKSVIVVRTSSGVKAFHNACRHRGVELVSGHGNCKKQGFVCPFHGWRFNMDGESTFVFGKKIFSEKSLEQAELNLVPCRVELWGGCAFINFDDDAPSLLDCMGPVAERLSARNVEGLKMEWWCSTVLPTNWKLAMEAFQEGYHTMKTHPQLNINLSAESNPYGQDADVPMPTPPATVEAFINATIRFIERLSEGMAGMIHPDELAIAKSLRDMDLPDDIPGAAMAFYGRLNQEITDQGRARGMPVPDLNELAARGDFSPVDFVFPNYFLLPFFSAMSSYRIRPLTPETCLFEIWSLAFIPDDADRKPVTEPTHIPYDSTEFPPIPQQDYSNLPKQQRGLHAGGFEYMRLSHKVEGQLSNYQRVIDGYLGGEDPVKLAKAQQIANGPFESPIKDLGL